MALPMIVKVVFVGKNIINNEELKIVRTGPYSMTAIDAACALEDGMYDKYGNSINEVQFQPLSFLKKAADKPGIHKFVAVMRQIVYNGVGSSSTFLFDVTYKEVNDE